MTINMEAVARSILMAPVQKKPDPLSWAVTEVTDALIARQDAGEIELQDLKEMAHDLRKDGGEIGRRVGKRLTNYILAQVEEEEVCPECFYDLEPGGIVSEVVGYYGNEPARQDIPTKMVCPECEYSEAI